MINDLIQSVRAYSPADTPDQVARYRAALKLVGLRAFSSDLP